MNPEQAHAGGENTPKERISRRKFMRRTFTAGATLLAGGRLGLERSQRVFAVEPEPLHNSPIAASENLDTVKSRETLLPSPTLRELADDGNTVIASQLVAYYTKNNLTYRRAASEIANMVISSGELSIRRVFRNFDWHKVLKNHDYIDDMFKAGNVPYEDELDFSQFDIIHDYATEQDVPIHAQHLFWPPDMPNDLAGLPQDEIFKVLEFFTKTRVLRNKGKVASWSVVNEAVAGKLYGNNVFKYWYNSPFSEALIDNIFLWTHEVDPDSKKVLNENHVLEPSTFRAISQGYLVLLKDLIDRRVPVQVAGTQNHLWIYDPPSGEDMIFVLNQIKELGVEAMATETTVAVSEQYPLGKNRQKKLQAISDPLIAQAQLFIDTLDAFKKNGFVFGMFGFSDAVSLYDSQNINVPDARAHILDANFEPRLAYFGLQNSLRKN